MKSTFQFGDKERHTFRVDFSYRTGREVYSLDGEEVRRTRHWGRSFSESFEIGGDEKHRLEVRVDTRPNWKSEVLLDDQLLITGLLPELEGIDSHMEGVIRFSHLYLLITLCAFFAFGFHRGIGFGLVLSSTAIGLLVAVSGVLFRRFLSSPLWSLAYMLIGIPLLLGFRQFWQVGLYGIAFFSFFVVFQTPIRRVLRRR